jgi:hypothetical protein
VSRLTDVTCVVKTLLRRTQLMRLVRSIRAFYPEVAIAIGDDSPQPLSPRDRRWLERARAEYHRLPVDVGLSEGRNRLIEGVETRYAVLCDDDFLFYRHTDLRFMRDVLEQGEVELLGAGYLDWSGRRWRRSEWAGHFERRGSELEMVPLTPASPWKRCDMTQNFFMVRVEALRHRQLRWDPSLKVGEHVEFFLQARERGLVVAHTPDVLVLHVRGENTPEYLRLRARALDYHRVWMQGRGLSRVLDPLGGVYELDASGELRIDLQGRVPPQTFPPLPGALLPRWQPRRSGAGRRPRRGLLRDTAKDWWRTLRAPAGRRLPHGEPANRG